MMTTMQINIDGGEAYQNIFDR